MLREEEAFDPIVLTRSKPGGAASVGDSSSGRTFSSLPARLAKGFRMGMVGGCTENVQLGYGSFWV